MTARNHHYISQCYLKGFTKDGHKKSKLVVVEFKEKKSFKTTPRNVGGLRDFNRIKVDGVDPNFIENTYADFEGDAAIALEEVEKTLEFQGENKDYILNLIALFSIRSPEQRLSWTRSLAHTAEVIMSLSVSSKERWESQMRKLQEKGHKFDDTVTYEQAKEFYEKKQYKIDVAKEHHIRREMIGVDSILQCLYKRRWLLIRATDESGPFITTDKPVNLTWKEPDTVPMYVRNSPGHGMRSTQLYFPVSKNLALVGEFDGDEGDIIGEKELISICNSKMLMHAVRQIYSPKTNFHFMGQGMNIYTGKMIINNLKSCGFTKDRMDHATCVPRR